MRSALGASNRSLTSCHRETTKPPNGVDQGRVGRHPVAMSAQKIGVQNEGRELEVVLEGDPDGILLIFHHGSPGAAVPYEPLDKIAAERGIKLATYSRPGFGDSTRDPGRTVASCAADVAAIADHLEAERFITIGWSGGGPHAIACAALLPERVASAATLAGVAPYDAKGLDWTAGMGEDNQVEYPLAAKDPEALLEWMQPHAQALSQVSPDDIFSSMQSLISPVDKGSLTGGFADMLARSFHHAFEHGPWGWYDDDLAFVQPWGFEIAEISVPISIWQGDHDLMVPRAHAEWMIEHIPTAVPQLRPEHGHLSLVGNIGDIFDDLKANAKL